MCHVVCVFDPITGECLLENKEKLNYVGSRCKTKNIIDFTKVCNRGIMNLFYQKSMNKKMGVEQSIYVYIK